MSLRSPLAKAVGLGSAKHGFSHWWWQRVTVIALVPLSVWFVYSVLTVMGMDHQYASDWLAQPFNASVLILFVLTMLYHAQTGIQVVIEDYVHSKGKLLFLIIFNKLFCWTFGLTAVFAILKITFAG